MDQVYINEKSGEIANRSREDGEARLSLVFVDVRGKFSTFCDGRRTKSEVMI